MPNESRLAFEVVDGPAKGHVLDLGSPMQIGRAGYGYGALGGDPELSRRHARVRPHETPDRVVIEDLGSTNGTWVNDRRIATATALRAGDVVGVGSTKLLVVGARLDGAGVESSSGAKGDERRAVPPRRLGYLLFGICLAVVPGLPFVHSSAVWFERAHNWAIFAGGLIIARELTAARATLRSRRRSDGRKPHRFPDRGPKMSLAMGLVIGAGAGTIATALPLTAQSLLTQEHPRVLVWIHVAFASALGAALVAKLLIISVRASLARAPEVWASLIADLGVVLWLYATLTGIFSITHERWANQHLAAAFWGAAVVIAHIIQVRRVGWRPWRRTRI
jgi:hypothetical protein